MNRGEFFSFLIKFEKIKFFLSIIRNEKNMAIFLKWDTLLYFSSLFCSNASIKFAQAFSSILITSSNPASPP